MFENIRNAILELDDLARRNGEIGQRINSCISDAMAHPERNVHSDNFDYEEWRAYIEEIELIEERITIGLLEDGTLLFLLRAEQEESRVYASEIREDGCTIHWYRENDSTWVLNNHGMVYHFELPKEIYRQWERTEGEQRQHALRIKRDYFSKIVLFNRRGPHDEDIQIIKLSEEFMRRAERSVERNLQ